MRKSLWPLWIVVALLVAASLACNVEFTTANIKNVKMTSDSDGKNETDTYGPTDTFYCIVDLRSAPDDTMTKAVWIAVVVEGVEPGFQIGEYELESGSGTLTFQVSPDELWPPGQYKVEIYLNGDLEKTVEFEVVAEAVS
ncbi:MAG: hypothetical protein JW966_14715 [Anaerolineae bacterium]|nr:hypothetical protein [Anaerolineae bacterium]